MQRIGFIGASGLMGHGMAKNLRAKGFPLALTVHSNRERIADLLAAGATLAATPAELARASDIVLLCVTGSPQVEAAVAGPEGLLSGAAPGLLIVDTSTAEPDSTSRLRAQCEGLGVPTIVGEGVHQSLALACSLGFGEKYVASRVEAQEKLTGAKIIPR